MASKSNKKILAGCLQSSVTAVMKDHEGMQFDTKLYKCRKCEESLSSIDDLQIHLMNHVETYAFETLTAAIMDKDRKPFQCNICDKRFFKNTQLRSHLKTHSEEKPYSCDMCGIDFGSKLLLKLHGGDRNQEKLAELMGRPVDPELLPLQTKTSINSDEKVHKCIICERAYVKCIDLIKHLDIHGLLMKIARQSKDA